jgi:putative oxidoreductase
MKNINECKQWIQTHADVLIDLIRMYLGVGLLVKGIYFLSHRSELEQLLAGAESLAFASAAVAHYVIPIHLGAGLLLAFGLLTRIAALLQIPILLGAVVFVHLPQMSVVTQRQSLEFSLLVLFLLALVFVHGSGRWSLDYLLSKRQSRQLQPQSSM